MVVTKQETLNHEELGAITKHKCGKDSSIVPSLFFSLFLFGLFGLFPYFVCVGNFGLFPFFYFLTWDNALIMMIITLLFTHNTILRAMMTL